MKHVGGVAAVVAAMGLVGCGGGATSSVSTTTTTATTTVTVTEPAESSAESAETEGTSVAGEVKYGEAIEGDVVNLKVSEVRDVTDPEYPDQGTWAAMIEICATADLGGPISPMQHFVLLDDEGSTYQPSGSSGGNLPTPQLDPGSVSVPEGKCRKGNLFFSAPTGASITGAEATDSEGISMGTWSKK